MAYEALFAATVLIRGHRGDRIDAYLARPLGAGPHPGVVVIHHMPGWDPATKEIARRFAHHGFVTIAPNLHVREGKATPEENSASVRAAGGMPDDRTLDDVEGAIDGLRALPYTSGKVGSSATARAAARPTWPPAPCPASTPPSTATGAASSPGPRS
jgi:carboxymethylenebutenolidase